MAQTKVKLVSNGVVTVDNLHVNHGITTDHVGEGSVLYYTDARVSNYLTTNNYATEAYVSTTTTNSANWDTAYSWGDHSLVGYLTSFTETDPIYTASSWYTTTNNAANWDTAFGWGNHASAGYLTSFTESDPVFTASAASGITSTNISNWNTAYGWGNHASQGYATQTYVNTAVAGLVDAAPATLDTLNELAAALGDDPNFATTVSTSIGTKWTQDNAKISNWDTAYNYSQVGHLPLSGGSISGNLHLARTSIITFYGNAHANHSISSRGIDWSETDDIRINSYGSVFVNLDSNNNNNSLADFVIGRHGGEETINSILLTLDGENGNLTISGNVNASGGNSGQWNTAYGWGNHASAGYLTSISEATSTVRGGIELFSDTDQSVAANAVSATSGRTYGIQLNSAGQAVVNVPWTDTNTTYSVGNGGLTQINFTSALNTKLAGIEASANNYSLPEATSTVRGGIELFSDTDQSVAANAVSATAGRTYGIQLNSAGQAVVNVPWTDTNTTYSVGNGGLTQINFTSALNTKLAGIATSANNYSHPSYTARSINTSGAAVLDILTVDTSGHVTAASTRNLTLADLGYTGATNANYITNNNELTNGAGFLTALNDRVYITDSRGAARAPSFYDDKYTQFDFQNTADTGAGGDTWHVLQTISPWSAYDNSHRQQQLVFTGTGGIKFRYASSETVWTGWQTLWTSGNDGAGSGLDADTVDGLQASSFLRSDADNASVRIGTRVTLTESADRADLLEITGTTSGWAGLQIRNSSNEGRWSFMTDGETAGIYNDEDNQWHLFFTEAAGAQIYHAAVVRLATSTAGISVTGTITSTGDVTANTSDRRLKENIKNIPNAIEKVKSINGVTFDWKEDLEDINYTRLRIHDVGVIAQEIQAVLPDAVRPAPFDTDEEGNSRSGENYLTVQYEKIVPLLIEAIKDQQQQIDELKSLLNK